jgi:hypothetical protein
MKTLCLLALALATCQPIPPPPSPPPVPDADAAPPPDARPDDCALAFQHLIGIGCEPRKPASGMWIDVCRNARRNGLFELECINRASTVAAARQCGVVCVPQ